MSLMAKAKEFMTDKVANIEKPEASVTDVDLADVGRDGVSYLATICLVNPYGVTIPVGEITYTLKSANSSKLVERFIPEASVTDVDLADVGRDGVSYLATICLVNPYGVTIPVGEITYTLKSANRVITSGNIPDPGSLKGNDKTTLEVRMKVPHSVCVSLVKDIGADWDIDYSLELGIVVDLPVVGNFKIPLTHTGEMKLPSLKDFF